MKIRPDRFLLFASLSVIGFYTVAPFDFAVSVDSLALRSNEALHFTIEDRPWRLAGHLIAFAFAGAVTVHVARNKTSPLRYVLCIGMILCVALESLQLLQVSRHARTIDLALNFGSWTAGASVTHGSTRMRLAMQTAMDYLQRHSRLAFTAVLLPTTGLWLAAGLSPYFKLGHLDWNPEYHLVVGNEEDRTEPWRGRIRLLRIYNTALTASQVGRLHRDHTSNGIHLESVPLVEYNFSSSSADLSHITPRGTIASESYVMDLPPGVAAPFRGEGLRFDGSYLVSRGPARELTSAIQTSRTFSIEAVLQPFGHQEGPARIISLSRDVWWRNFMFGQEDDNLVFRVRNGVNGEDALKNPCSAFEVIDHSMQHLVAVYDHGVSRLYRNGRPIGPVIDLRDPSFQIGLGSGHASWAAGAVLLVSLVSFPTFIVTSTYWRRWIRHVVALVVTLGAGCGPYMLSPVFIGGRLEVGQFVWVILALMALYPRLHRWAREAGPSGGGLTSGSIKPTLATI